MSGPSRAEHQHSEPSWLQRGVPVPSDDVFDALRALEASAKQMNALSDAVNARFKAVEDALRSANIGIARWVGCGEVGSTQYELGFEHVENQWRIVVRETLHSPAASALGVVSPTTPNSA